MKPDPDLAQALHRRYRAVFSDVDDTLTDSDRNVPADCLRWLAGLLASAVPVCLASARGMRGDMAGNGRSLLEVADAVAAFAEGDPQQSFGSAETLLEYLYLAPENGAYLTRADRPDVPLD